MDNKRFASLSRTMTACRKVWYLHHTCGLTVREIEKRTGVSDSTVCRILKVKRWHDVVTGYSPTKATVEKIEAYKHYVQHRLIGF